MERNPFTEKLSLIEHVRLWLCDGAGARVHGWSTRQWLAATAFLLLMALALLSVATFVVMDLLPRLCLQGGIFTLLVLSCHAIRCALKAETINHQMGW